MRFYPSLITQYLCVGSSMAASALFLAAGSPAAARSAVVLHAWLLRVPGLPLLGRVCPADRVLPLLDHDSSLAIRRLVALRVGQEPCPLVLRPTAAANRPRGRYRFDKQRPTLTEAGKDRGGPL